MREFILEIDVVNSEAIALAVLKKITGTKTVIKGYRAVENSANDEYAIVSVTVESTTKKISHIKKLLESYEEIVDVSINEEGTVINYYQCNNS